MGRAKGEVRGVMYAEIELEVKNIDGKIIETRKLLSRSLVANLLRVLRRMFIPSGGSWGPATRYVYYSGTEPVDVGGTARGVLCGTHSTVALPLSYPSFKVDGEIGVTTCGIRVGVGTTSVTPTDYNLATPIAEGTGSGQLSHGATTIDTISIVGSTTTLRIIRTFTNNTTGAVTVNEIGLFAYCAGVAEAMASIMLARDLITPVSVPVNSTLTVRYILRTTV